VNILYSGCFLRFCLKLYWRLEFLSYHHPLVLKNSLYNFSYFAALRDLSDWLLFVVKSFYCGKEVFTNEYIWFQFSGVCICFTLGSTQFLLVSLRCGF